MSENQGTSQHSFDLPHSAARKTFTGEAISAFAIIVGYALVDTLETRRTLAISSHSDLAVQADVLPERRPRLLKTECKAVLALVAAATFSYFLVDHPEWRQLGSSDSSALST